MSDLNINFEPYSDISVSSEETIASHDDYIKKNMYEMAKTVVDNDSGMNRKGIRASLFNAINRKIQELQIYLLNKKAAPYEYYSLTEPTIEFMEENNYKFWIKPVE